MLPKVVLLNKKGSKQHLYTGASEFSTNLADKRDQYPYYMGQTIAYEFLHWCSFGGWGCVLEYSRAAGLMNLGDLVPCMTLAGATSDRMREEATEHGDHLSFVGRPGQ